MANLQLSNILFIAGLIVLFVATSLVFGGVQFNVFTLETPLATISGTGLSSGQVLVLIVGFGLIILGGVFRYLRM